MDEYKRLLAARNAAWKENERIESALETMRAELLRHGADVGDAEEEADNDLTA